jgi:hypothetical protein
MDQYERYGDSVNSLALIAVGLILGSSVMLIAGIGAALLWAVFQQRSQTEAVGKLIQAQTQAMKGMKGEIALGLSRMDAERMYEASLAIQRSSQTLRGQVKAIQKAMFRSDPEGLDLSTQIPDDSEMGPDVDGFGNPLAGLSEEERQRQLNEYLERRRATQRSGIRHIGDTPPTPMSGVYAQYIEDMKANPPAPKPPADLHDEPGTFDGEESEGTG